MEPELHIRTVPCPVCHEPDKTWRRTFYISRSDGKPYIHAKWADKRCVDCVAARKAARQERIKLAREARLLMTHRVCKYCQVDKPIAEYPRQGSGKIYAHCRDCRRDRERNRYHTKQAAKGIKSFPRTTKGAKDRRAAARPVLTNGFGERSAMDYARLTRNLFGICKGELEVRGLRA